MRRVVVTGLGVVSSIGNNLAEVTDSLKNAKSGIVAVPDLAEKGFRSQVEGSIKLDATEILDRKAMRYMGDGAAYQYIAILEALREARLREEDYQHERSGVVLGSGGVPCPRNLKTAWDDMLEKKKTRAITPFIVNRVMGSSSSAVIGTLLKVKGTSYTISSACATSAHCIGHAAELIQFGKLDIVFAGGGEALFWGQSALFDAMKALSSNYNDTPKVASRAYDKDRDGFVMSGGGGALVLESLESAQKRGAPILAELVGYGSTADGADMVQPSGEGATRCMKMAMENVHDPIDYVNTHGTSTPIGDSVEMKAIRGAFGDNIPPLSSTKSLTGHSLAGAGVHEAIYCLLMMHNDFLAESAHIENLDPEFSDFPILRKRRDGPVRTVMSNSFGFGGTNACLVFQKPS